MTMVRGPRTLNYPRNPQLGLEDQIDWVMTMWGAPTDVGRVASGAPDDGVSL